MTDFSQPKSLIFPDTIARAKREHFESYMGDVRAPFYPDEAGATAVVDLRLPEPRRARLKFVKDAGEWFRVISLPSP